MAENRVTDANFAFGISIIRFKLEEFSSASSPHLDVATLDLKTTNGLERDLVIRSELEGMAVQTREGNRIEIPTMEVYQPRRLVQDTDYHLGTANGLSILARRRALLNRFGTELKATYTLKLGSMTTGETPSFKLPFPAQEYMRSRFEDIQ